MLNKSRRILQNLRPKRVSTKLKYYKQVGKSLKEIVESEYGSIEIS